MKPTKEQAKLHREAAALVALDRDLTEDEKEFVLRHWQAGTTGVNSLDGAFFTPLGMAFEFNLEVHGDRILDLCAGIGRLSWGCRELLGRRWQNQPPREFVCVEKNPAYVAVGRRVLPEATWIEADVFDVLDMDLGSFDCVISNPPFGSVKRSGNGPRYRGRRFEYHVIDVASRLAPQGAFILPQQSAPFRYSGKRCYTVDRDAECRRFEQKTGIILGETLGIDTTFWDGEWHGVNPATEIVPVDFTEMREPVDTRPKAGAVTNVRFAWEVPVSELPLTREDPWPAAPVPAQRSATEELSPVAVGSAIAEPVEAEQVTLF